MLYDANGKKIGIDYSNLLLRSAQNFLLKEFYRESKFPVQLYDGNGKPVSSSGGTVKFRRYNKFKEAD
jgi:nitrogen fixation protein FixH